MRLQELGFEIRQRRREQGLTQAQVAHGAGVSRTTLNQLENGVFPDLGVRKVQAILDYLGLTLAIQPMRKPARPNFVQMASTTASVSFRVPLTEDELVNVLLTGKVPPGKRPHLRSLLDEASPALLNGLIEEVSQWSKPGRVEKNLAKIGTDVDASRRIDSWLNTAQGSGKYFSTSH
jgi:transcriptional regulator with XRE-family HTH domain